MVVPFEVLMVVSSELVMVVSFKVVMLVSAVEIFCARCKGNSHTPKTANFTTIFFLDVFLSFFLNILQTERRDGVTFLKAQRTTSDAIWKLASIASLLLSASQRETVASLSSERGQHQWPGQTRPRAKLAPFHFKGLRSANFWLRIGRRLPFRST